MTCSLILVIRQKFRSPRMTGWPIMSDAGNEAFFYNIIEHCISICIDKALFVRYCAISCAPTTGFYIRGFHSFMAFFLTVFKSMFLSKYKVRYHWKVPYPHRVYLQKLWRHWMMIGVLSIRSRNAKGLIVKYKFTKIISLSLKYFRRVKYYYEYYYIIMIIISKGSNKKLIIIDWSHLWRLTYQTPNSNGVSFN